MCIYTYMHYIHVHTHIYVALNPKTLDPKTLDPKTHWIRSVHCTWAAKRRCGARGGTGKTCGRRGG